jgi:hypothetical protein
MGMMEAIQMAFLLTIITYVFPASNTSFAFYDIQKFFQSMGITVYLVHCFQRLWIEEEDRYT